MSTPIPRSSPSVDDIINFLNPVSSPSSPSSQHSVSRPTAANTADNDYYYSDDDDSQSEDESTGGRGMYDDRNLRFASSRILDYVVPPPPPTSSTALSSSLNSSYSDSSSSYESDLSMSSTTSCSYSTSSLCSSTPSLNLLSTKVGLSLIDDVLQRINGTTTKNQNFNALEEEDEPNVVMNESGVVVSPPRLHQYHREGCEDEEEEEENNGTFNTFNSRKSKSKKKKRDKKTKFKGIPRVASLKPSTKIVTFDEPVGKINSANGEKDLRLRFKGNGLCIKRLKEEVERLKVELERPEEKVEEECTKEEEERKDLEKIKVFLKSEKIDFTEARKLRSEVSTKRRNVEKIEAENASIKSNIVKYKRTIQQVNVEVDKVNKLIHFESSRLKTLKKSYTKSKKSPQTLIPVVKKTDMLKYYSKLSKYSSFLNEDIEEGKDELKRVKLGLSRLKREVEEGVGERWKENYYNGRAVDSPEAKVKKAVVKERVVEEEYQDKMLMDRMRRVMNFDSDSD
ncbi:hypothetical protein TrLO_g9628 [Triparma laevis f. longispina]|uniref:Uncharacterized protein n=1 Tax=Triparma laevis f. longispina TaxID=1714387 RepID=A0A9W7FRQ8_9STRA|nr:hypothetical protein TrLO_g9628 [Triparma laevis f. longispina]